MVFIYTLQLQKGKYYVGKTDNPKFRLDNHFNSNGSAWTNLYKPIKVLEIIPNCDNYDEDKYTRKYMDKYGIDNVRGGTYVTEELDEVSKYQLQKELWATNDCCTQCGRKGHFVKNCKATKDVNGNDIYVYEQNEEYIQIWQCDHCGREYEDKSACAKHEKICKSIQLSKTCFQCGETGHYANECTNEEEEDDDEEETFNCSYCDKEFDTEKGKRFHENVYCRSKSIGGGKSSSVKYNACSRCGRVGHNASKCYARTDADGDELDSNKYNIKSYQNW